MKLPAKVLVIDLLRILSAFYSVIYFLLALAAYFEAYRSTKIFYQAWLEKIAFGKEVFAGIFGNQAYSTVIGYFFLGLVFLAINFLLDSLQGKLNASGK